jgi:NitT/TauT family transport system substrate-binding protein
MPQTYVQNGLVTKADYIAALAQDKGQFLPDGIMPAGGPRTVLAMEVLIGHASASQIDLAKTFTNEFAIAANKAEGFSTTTTPATAAG